MELVITMHICQTAVLMLSCDGAGVQTSTSAPFLIHQVNQTSLPLCHAIPKEKAMFSSL
jgi:hypothetical protein